LGTGLLVEVLLGEMTDRFGGAFFDLGLDLRCGCCLIDKDSELIVSYEEAACGTLTIGIELDGLNREVTHVTAHNDANETKKATGLHLLVLVLGAVLHTDEPKHGFL
jgi:hypothetical protein